MSHLISAGLTLIAMMARYIWAFKAGKARERATKSQRIHQAALRAARQRDYMLGNDRYAKRLRERFTR